MQNEQNNKVEQESSRDDIVSSPAEVQSRLMKLRLEMNNAQVTEFDDPVPDGPDTRPKVLSDGTRSDR